MSLQATFGYDPAIWPPTALHQVAWEAACTCVQWRDADGDDGILTTTVTKLLATVERSYHLAGLPGLPETVHRIRTTLLAGDKGRLQVHLPVSELCV